jgi:serine/threonine protein kinase
MSSRMGSSQEDKKKQGYGKEVDVWSLGAILYVLYAFYINFMCCLLFKGFLELLLLMSHVAICLSRLQEDNWSFLMSFGVKYLNRRKIW